MRILSPVRRSWDELYIFARQSCLLSNWQGKENSPTWITDWSRTGKHSTAPHDDMDINTVRALLSGWKNVRLWLFLVMSLQTVVSLAHSGGGQRFSRSKGQSRGKRPWELTLMQPLASVCSNGLWHLVFWKTFVYTNAEIAPWLTLSSLFPYWVTVLSWEPLLLSWESLFLNLAFFFYLLPTWALIIQVLLNRIGNRKTVHYLLWLIRNCS